MSSIPRYDELAICLSLISSFSSPQINDRDRSRTLYLRDAYPEQQFCVAVALALSPISRVIPMVSFVNVIAYSALPTRDTLSSSNRHSARYATDIRRQSADCLLPVTCPEEVSRKINIFGRRINSSMFNQLDLTFAGDGEIYRSRREEIN